MPTEPKLTAAERAPKIEAPAQVGVLRLVRWIVETERRYRVTQDRIHGSSDTF